MKTLTLRRTGEFTVRTKGATPCGVQNPQRIRYIFMARCAIKLDARGFLFEQLNVDRFFQKLKSTDLSCELLVIDCVKHLRKQILKEHPKCKLKGLSLELIAAPYAASMRFDWVV